MSWSDMISTKFISGHETIQDTGTKTIGRIRGVIFEQLWKIGRIRRVATHLALMFQQQPLSAPEKLHREGATASPEPSSSRRSRCHPVD
jgi:hypothetical protein